MNGRAACGMASGLNLQSRSLKMRVEALTWPTTIHPLNYWETVMNPLETLQGTVIAGVVLAVILAYVATQLAGA